MVSDYLRAVVLERLFSHFPLYTHPAPWAGAPVDPSVRTCPSDPPAVVDLLSREFSAADLIDSGVARLQDDGALLPADAWCHPGEAVIALRAREDALPFDMMTSSGCLSGRLPLAAVAEDVLSTRSDSKQICITQDVIDVAVLRSQDLAACIAVGLEQIVDPGRLAELCRVLGWHWDRARPNHREWCRIPTSPSPDDDEGDAVEDNGGAVAEPDDGDVEESHDGTAVDDADEGGAVDEPEEDRADEDLGDDEPDDDAELERPAEPEEQPTFEAVLLGWSTVGLTQLPTDTWLGLAEVLAGIEQHLDIDDIDLMVWRPGEELFEPLRFRLAFDPSAPLHGLLRTSCNRATSLDIPHPPVPGLPPPDSAATRTESEPPLDLLQARDRLRRLLQQPSPSAAELAKARAAVWAAYENAFVEPLLRQATGLGDPVRASRLVALAHTNSLMFRDSMTMDEYVWRHGYGCQTAGGASDLASASNFLRLVQTTSTLSRELDR